MLMGAVQRYMNPVGSTGGYYVWSRFANGNGGGRSGGGKTHEMEGGRMLWKERQLLRPVIDVIQRLIKEEPRGSKSLL